MKRVKMLIMVAASLGIGWAAGAWKSGTGGSGGLSSSHTGLTIEQVKALATLVTARVDVADVLETKLEGRTGSIKAALLVKGDFLLGTDLSRAKLQSVDVGARTAVLILPQPQVTSPRLDHERTRVFAVTETGLWLLTPGDNQTSALVVQRAYAQAQHYISQVCSDPSLLARSRQQAEQVLVAFFRTMGWTVSVIWME